MPAGSTALLSEIKFRATSASATVSLCAYLVSECFTRNIRIGSPRTGCTLTMLLLCFRDVELTFTSLLDEVATALEHIEIPRQITDLSKFPQAEKIVATVLRRLKCHSIPHLEDVVGFAVEVKDTLDPGQGLTVRILKLYLAELRRSSAFLEESTELGTKRVVSAVGSKARMTRRKRQRKTLGDGDDSEGDSVIEIDGSGTRADGNGDTGDNAADEESEEDDEDEKSEEEEADDRTFKELIGDYLNIASAKQAKQKMFEVDKQLDEDIERLCNENPFDSPIHERVLAKEYKKIPWVPNFQASYPPRWPNTLLSMADDSLPVPAQRSDQDSHAYNRFKEATLKKLKEPRIREDQQQCNQQLACTQHMRLAAVLFQRSRTQAKIMQNLLGHSRVKLTNDQAEQFQKYLRMQENVEKLHTLSIKLHKAMLAKATRNRRYAFLRHAGDLQHLNDVILNQKVTKVKEGELDVWHMVSSDALTRDVTLEANLRSNLSMIKSAKSAESQPRPIQPFSSGHAYGGYGRGQLPHRQTFRPTFNSGYANNSYQSFGRGFYNNYGRPQNNSNFRPHFAAQGTYASPGYRPPQGQPQLQYPNGGPTEPSPPGTFPQQF